MRVNSFYKNEFIYKGWKVMMIKAGLGNSVIVNFWPGIDLDKLATLERTDKPLYDKLNQIFMKNVHNKTFVAPGRTPNFDVVVSEVKSFVDWNLGTFDLSKKFQE